MWVYSWRFDPRELGGARAPEARKAGMRAARDQQMDTDA